MMEATAGDHLNGKQIMGGGGVKEGSDSPLVSLGCTCLPVQFVVFIYRFLGNALCILLSICVDHFLLKELVQSDSQSRGPDQKQAQDNSFSPF